MGPVRLREYIAEDIRKHLEDRGVVPYDPKYPVYMDTEVDVAYFPLFNLSGRFVGYQRYNPEGTKGKESYKVDKENKKYYTYVTRENPEKNVPYTALYGLHTLDKRPYLFIVEGIFDAVKLIKMEEPVVAVLANNPKQLKNFFFVLQKKVISIEDRDLAGSKLKRLADKSFVVPEPYKDLGEMPQKEVIKFIKSIKK